jgi:hypothetical protein
MEDGGERRRGTILDLQSSIFDPNLTILDPPSSILDPQRAFQPCAGLATFLCSSSRISRRRSLPTFDFGNMSRNSI